MLDNEFFFQLCDLGSSPLPHSSTQETFHLSLVEISKNYTQV